MSRSRPTMAAIAALLTLTACIGASDSTPAAGPSVEGPPATTTSPVPAPSSTTVGATTSGNTPTTGVATKPPIEFPESYDVERRTATELSSIAEFESLARSGVGGQQATKFSILGWEAGEPVVEWLDGRVFDLHDEWYYFQLLNGRQIAGFDVQPIEGLDFDSVADVYAWAEERRGALPLDLRFTGLGRLVSDRFYDAALDDPDDRPIALGKVIRIPASTTGIERWLLELEFSDRSDADDIARFFEVLSPALPPEVSRSLVWVPRSREQEVVAAAMRDEHLAYGDRTIRYADIVDPGDTEVYASGIAAGRLMMITDAGRWALSDAEPTDIVVVQRTPDALPPASAFITSTPQTPLSHVNVLAINRGIPNAFLGGAVSNEELEQLGRARAPVLIRAIEPGQLDIRRLTESEYRRWRDLQGRGPISVARVDTDDIPLTLSIADLVASLGDDGTISETDVAGLRPIIGGKAAGFIGLAAPGSVTMPDRPLAITVRAYREHVAPLDGIIADMLASREFERSTRARLVLTEGTDALLEVDGSDAAVTWIKDFVDNHPPGTSLGDIVAAGGLKEMIRDIDVDPGRLGAVTADLARNFDGYAPTQGFRFRSSSSVEDIEGFNGAGLYSSNTGFLDPLLLSDSDDHKRTVARALQRTWSSYWNIEAVEERQLDNVDHLSGAMAVLVHARFDDPLERANGVATFTILPTGDTVMRANAQRGAVSVTNPDNEPDQTPEVVAVRSRFGEDRIDVERIGASSPVDGGSVVVDDEQLVALHQQLNDVTMHWLNRVNDGLPTEQRNATLTLDFEFRDMAAGWPTVTGQPSFDARMVVKQARTLEPSIRRLPSNLRDLPVGRDILARTIRIEQRDCPTVDDPVARFALFTDPLANVDFGYATEPLVVTIDGANDDGSCDIGVVFTSPTDYLLSLLDTDE